MIAGSHLKITATKIITLTKEDINIIYLDDIKTDLMKVIKNELIGTTVEVWIVAGKDAVIKLA